MSSGTCHQMVDDGSGGRCGRPKAHPGDHLPDAFSQIHPAYDLTVLRYRLDTVTVSTAESRRLRARREQLTAELDGWSYLAKVAERAR